MCLKWFGYKIVKIDEDDTSLPPPKYLENIDYTEISTILKAEFPNAAIHLADRKYKTTSKTEFNRFITHDLVNKNIYISEYYDCDDFSFALMGEISNQEWGALPFGILWTEVPGGAHAVNCFIDKKREVWIVEPQNDKIFKCPVDWNPYFIVI